MAGDPPTFLPNSISELVAAYVAPDGTTVVPASAATPLPVVSTNPAIIYTDQQKVTASAVALTAQALANGIIIKAKATNAGTVFVGGSGVNATYDGTGNGFPLDPGESIGFGVTDASVIYVIGILNDVISVAGN